jgi:hypothetical protein
MASGDDWKMDLPPSEIVLPARERLREDVASELEARRRLGQHVDILSRGESAQRPNHSTAKGLPRKGLQDGRVPPLAI